MAETFEIDQKDLDEIGIETLTDKFHLRFKDYLGSFKDEEHIASRMRDVLLVGLTVHASIELLLKYLK